MKKLILLFALVCSPIFAAPVPLFDGKTLEGWDYDPKIWRVEDGVITGGSTTDKITANYFIATKKSYANFELRLKIKCSGDPKTGMINSGIQIRSVRVPGGAHMSGYQVDCGAGWFGKIYDEFRRNRVIWAPTPEQQAALDKVVDVFGWNEYRIRAEGPRIQTWINGVLCIDYTEADKNIALDGQIAPQVHSGGIALVQVKDVTIEELPPTPGAPTWDSLGGVEAARKLVAPPPKPAAAAAPAKRDISYNAVQGTAKTAAEQQKLFKLPEGYEIELVVQESDGIGKFVSVYFDQRGRMWTQTAFEYPVDANENPAVAEALYKSPGKDKVLVYPREALNAPLPPGGLTKPTVFADGLAIPLGILPWGNGDTCYIQHGHDLKLFKDTNGDGKADTHEVILTGFGVQDSHLFPHQFTRAPGGWIWMAQGLFNNSKAVKPGGDKVVDWPKCSMAKMRPDGSQFEVTSVGPNNIWGLVITGEGESFIQEANDYGYPVMPFHEYAYYPGGMEALKRSYQPDFPPQAEFRMGGTGLSGLALGEGDFRKLTPTLKDDGLCMIVANPITSKVQTIAMHRDGLYWKLEQAPDLITCDDPFFRPVALTNGPDGCIYIVDWYNKIISHNEVPRTHPDRDKTRGRIWRVKPKGAKPVAIPDFTKLSGDELIAKLGAEPLAQSHLAWQTIADRSKGGGLWEEKWNVELTPKLERIAKEANEPAARRIQAIWALKSLNQQKYFSIARRDLELRPLLPRLSEVPNRNIRRELIRMDQGHAVATDCEDLVPLKSDVDAEVRAQVIRTLGDGFYAKFTEDGGRSMFRGVEFLLQFVRDSLAEPVAPSARNGKPILIREAYDRAFERFLVRMFLERQPEAVAKFLDSDAAKPLTIEARLLASLALEPKASSARVAKLLPQLQRAPGQEEVLRLAQFPEEPGVGEALKAILANPATRASTLDALLAVRTKLDAAKLAPFLADASNLLLSGKDTSGIDLGVKLASGFALRGAEPTLVALAQSGPQAPAAVRALAEIGSNQAELFAKLAETSTDALLRDEALAALASAKSAAAPARVLALYPKLTASQRKTALERLSATKPGASAILTALESGKLAKTDLDASILDRLQAVLGANDPMLAKLVDSLGALFRPVLMLDGSDNAWSQTKVTLEGPCAIEAWVRLDPDKRKIGNADGIAGAPGQLDINFFGETARVYAFPPLADVVVAKKPITPGLWTHVAATRDAQGIWKIYLDGELNATGAKAAPHKIENLRLAWTSAGGGPRGALAEVRVWSRERTADEIRAASDRSLPANTPGLVFTSTSDDWGKLQAGAKIAKTSDFPPILSGDEAAALDAKYAKFRALAEKPGDAEKGKTAALLCQACHLFGTTGGNIGPNLSGVGAMGTEAILRNILQPNAAMENGYRIYRVELKNGDLIDAMFVSEDKDAVVVRLPGSQDRRIAKAEIRATKFLRRSLMPEGLLDTMQPEQVSDLFAYFKTLK